MSPDPSLAMELSRTDLPHLVEQAMQTYEQADFTVCEDLCQRILLINPDDFSGNQLLGVLRARQGQLNEAIKFLSKAHEIRPDSKPVIQNIVNVMELGGNYPEALKWLDRQIALKEGRSDLYFRRGHFQLKLGREKEAIGSYCSGLELDRSNLGAAIKLTELYFANADYEVAVEWLEPSLAFHMDKEQAEEGQDESIDLSLSQAHSFMALACLRRAEEKILARGYLEAKGDPVLLYPQLEAGDEATDKSSSIQQDYEQAGEAASKALAYNPDNDEAKIVQGFVYLHKGETDKAQTLANSLVRDHPTRPDALFLLARLIDLEGDDLKSEAAYGKALYMADTNPSPLWQMMKGDAHFRRGRALVRLHRPFAAQAAFQQAAETTAAPALAKPALGALDLGFGTYETGFKRYAQRNPMLSFVHKMGIAKDSSDKLPPSALLNGLHHSDIKWNAIDQVQGKELVLFSENGPVDFLLFARYLPLFGDRLKKLTLLLRPEEASLAKVLAPVRCVSATVLLEGALPEAEVWIAAQNLPFLFGTAKPENVPVPLNLLGYPPSEEKWRAKIIKFNGEGKKRKKRIGLAPIYDHQSGRDLRPNLEDLIKATQNLKDVDYFCLTPVQGKADRALLKKHHIRYFEEAAQNYTELVALTRLMDHVIGADSAALHIAAALGRKSWIILPRSPDWWWGFSGETSPWYPEARLYRPQDGWELTKVLEEIDEDILYEQNQLYAANPD